MVILRNNSMDVKQPESSKISFFFLFPCYYKIYSRKLSKDIKAHKNQSFDQFFHQRGQIFSFGCGFGFGLQVLIFLSKSMNN